VVLSTEKRIPQKFLYTLLPSLNLASSQEINLIQSKIEVALKGSQPFKNSVKPLINWWIRYNLMSIFL